MLETRIVKDYRECRRLLKKVYCDEKHWSPPLDNLINHRIVKDELCDDYDDSSNTVWLGVYDNNLLVGCARVFVGNRYSHELDSYMVEACFDGDINPILMNGMMPDMYVELNRIASMKGYLYLAYHHLISNVMKIAILYGIPVVSLSNPIMSLLKEHHTQLGSVTYPGYPSSDVYLFSNPLTTLKRCNHVLNL